jgi:MYXO-CTERM domain-containing protein
MCTSGACSCLALVAPDMSLGFAGGDMSGVGMSGIDMSAAPSTGNSPSGGTNMKTGGGKSSGCAIAYSAESSTAEAWLVGLALALAFRRRRLLSR